MARKTPIFLADPIYAWSDDLIAITIPLYTVSANVREWPWKRARRVRDERLIVKQYLRCGMPANDNAIPLHVNMVRLGPKELDTVNMHYALKAAQDEVAAFFGVDDGPQSPIAWTFESEHSRGYGVRVEISR